MKALLRYFGKTISWLNELAEKEGLSKLWLYFDYASAAIWHRCLIRQYVIGEFWRASSAERKRRITYNRIVKLYDKLNSKEYIHYLNEKPEFNAYFSKYVRRDWLHIINVSYDEFCDFLVKYDSVIIKPVDAMQGRGIRKFTLSEVPDTNLLDMYENLRKENVLIEQIIVQHPKMIFGNASVNTIRMYTILDEKGKAHPLKAILRAGVGNSVVDNYCQGGAIYEVDLETGLVCTSGQSRSDAKNYIHPGSDIVMLGYRIPNWDKVIQTCICAAELLPQVRFIGWDVAVTSDSVELIEGNQNPDYELLEFIGSRGYYKKIKDVI